MLTLNEIYQYVLGDFAKIDLSRIPEAHRAKKLKAFKTATAAKFSFLNDRNKPYFRAMLRQQKSADLETILFGNATDEIKLSEEETQIFFARQLPNDTAIEKKFAELNFKYHYLDELDDQTLPKFKKYFQACKLIGEFVEGNNDVNNESAFLNAYKIYVIFGDTNSHNIFKKVDLYLKNFNFLHRKQPVHDAFLNNIPVHDGNSSLSRWRTFIGERGPLAMRLFELAPGIRAHLNKEPETFEVAQEAARQLTYTRASEHPELAKLCQQYFVTETVFNECLGHEKTRKKSDNLPDIIVDGSKHGHPDYFIAKLPLDDPRAYLLGNITNCCQHITGVTRQCIIDGITLPKNGFYVLLRGKGKSPFTPDGKIDYKRFILLGQSYAGYTKDGNFLIDSWENRTPASQNHVTVALLKHFGKKIMAADPNVSRVLIGCGGAGKTPSEFNAVIRKPEAMKEGYTSHDASRQALVAFNPAIKIEIGNKVAALKVRMRQHKLLLPTDKSLLNRLFPTNEIDSLKIVDIFADIFLHQNNRSLWTHLVKRHPEKLEALASHYALPSIMSALQQMHRLQMLNQKTFDIYFDAISNYFGYGIRSEIVRILNRLQPGNSRNEISFHSQLKEFYADQTKQRNCFKLEKIQESIAELEKAQIPLTAEIRAAITFNSGHEGIAYGLKRLKEGAQLSDQTQKMILSDPKHAMDIAELIIANTCTEEYQNPILLATRSGESIKLLKDAGIYSAETLQDMFNNTFDAYHLASIYASLSRAGLFHEFRQRVLMQIEKIRSLTEISSYLEKSSALNSDTFNALLIYLQQNPESNAGPSLSKIINTMSAIGVLNISSFMQVITNPNEFLTTTELLHILRLQLNCSPLTRSEEISLWSNRERNILIMLLYIELNLNGYLNETPASAGKVHCIINRICKSGFYRFLHQFTEQHPDMLSQNFIALVIAIAEKNSQSNLSSILEKFLSNREIDTKSVFNSGEFVWPLIQVISALNERQRISSESVTTLCNNGQHAKHLNQIIVKAENLLDENDIERLIHNVTHAEKICIAMSVISHVTTLTKKHVKHLLDQPEKATQYAEQTACAAKKPLKLSSGSFFREKKVENPVIRKTFFTRAGYHR